MQHYLIALLTDAGIQPANLIAAIIILCIILLIALAIHIVLHKVLLRYLNAFNNKRPNSRWMAMLLKHKIFNQLAFVLQGLIVYIQAQLWLSPDTAFYTILDIASQIWILVFGTLSFFALLDIWLEIAQKNGLAKHIPVRGCNQGIKIIVATLVTIIIISLLIGRSPTLLLSGLGAMTAVLMLVFKDPLLGLVAGIQLSVNKMLNVGDWLEMPKYGADGDVIDISLTTVKVQNWDKTITTIPTYALISDSFINWRGMSESGGRRIKRCIYIDATSVHFLSTEDCQTLKKAHLLAPYIEQKITELDTFNQEKGGDLSLQINGRRLTNLGTFRAYLEAYLRAHPHIHQGMTLMVRQRAPTSNGIPLEIYAFTNTTQWIPYENIQSDIFDHTFAVIAEFGLRVHQTPTGNDVRALGSALIK